MIPFPGWPHCLPLLEPPSELCSLPRVLSSLLICRVTVPFCVLRLQNSQASWIEHIHCLPYCPLPWWCSVSLHRATAPLSAHPGVTLDPSPSFLTTRPPINPFLLTTASPWSFFSLVLSSTLPSRQIFLKYRYDIPLF